MLREQWGVSETCTDSHSFKRKIQEAKEAVAGDQHSMDGAPFVGKEAGIKTNGAGQNYPFASGG